MTEKADSSLSRWQHVQKMRDHFWQRWSREYLHALTTRPKWFMAGATPHIGSLRLITSEMTPPSRWPLAPITKLHSEEDGITRVVIVRTTTSELIRPLVKLVMLPDNAASSRDA